MAGKQKYWKALNN